MKKTNKITSIEWRHRSFRPAAEIQDIMPEIAKQPDPVSRSFPAPRPSFVKTALDCSPFCVMIALCPAAAEYCCFAAKLLIIAKTRQATAIRKNVFPWTLMQPCRRAGTCNSSCCFFVLTADRNAGTCVNISLFLDGCRTYGCVSGDKFRAQ